MAKSTAKNKTITFVWDGVDRDRRKLHGELEAGNLRMAKLRLRQRGIRIRKIRKQAAPLFSIGGKVKVNDIVFFTRQLATMIEAGIPIAQSLHGISKGHENPGVKKLLDQIREDVESGSKLSSTLNKHTSHFNKLYVSLVRIGEESGTLDTLMEKIATHLEQIERIKSKVRSALFYPVLVMLVALIVVAILLIKVIPEFETLFQDFGADLPVLTRWIVDVSHAFQEYWLIVLLASIGAISGLVFSYKRTPAIQQLADRLLLRFPIFGAIIRKAIIARVSRTLSTMFTAGVPLANALETVAHASGNYVYTRGILNVRQAVVSGATLEDSMASTDLFPGMALQMIATGEKAGELDRMLDKVANFYENEVDNAVAVISSLVEPFLIIFLGVITGTIVVAMYLPIFKLGSVF